MAPDVTCMDAAMTPLQLCDRLHELGFAILERGDNHLLLSNGSRRVLVPTHSASIPRWVERAVEWTLDPAQRAGWLRDPRPRIVPTPEADARVLHCVIEADGDGWHGFVVEQYEILTFGDSPEQVEQRLREAARLWVGPNVPLDVVRVGAGGTGA
jgi:hypothetical protein